MKGKLIFTSKAATIVALLVFLSGINLVAQPLQVIPAPALALPNAKGDTLRLTDFSGKVVLVDFWASWCAPCRVANKGLVKIYSQFSKKGLVILGVSLDESNEAWQKAIRKDGLKWIQVIDLKAWDSPVAAAWDVNAIPANFLIDCEGNIVAHHLAGKELESAIAQALEKK
jgi:peroxiredoxin